MNSFNDLIVSIVQIMPKSLVKIFSSRYIAGDKLDDAVRVVKELNQKGIYATMDVLGEAITSKDEAIEAKKECIEVIETIEKEKLNSNLSIKPTQFGLQLDENFCYQQVEELVIKAKKRNNFIRIDMEDSSCTDKTFTLVKRLKEKYDNVGVVVQAYLKRSLNDVKELSSVVKNFRLCKGIYIEPPEIAFKDKQQIRDNYLDILKFMLENNIYVGIATHDDYLVNAAYKMIDDMKIPKDRYEFQMLLGVKENLRDKINNDGHKIRVYVPFGTHWYNYSIRRLKENPNVAGNVFKSIFHLN